MKEIKINSPDYEFRLVLHSADQQSKWSTVANFFTSAGAPPQFIVFFLPHTVKPPVMPVQQLDGGHAAFELTLEGPPAAAQEWNLSDVDQRKWMPTLRQIVVGAKPAVILLQNSGRLTVALHEGVMP